MTRNELKTMREGFGWSQTEAAELLDMSLRTYQYYEHGERSDKQHNVPRWVAKVMLAHKFIADWKELENAG